MKTLENLFDEVSDHFADQGLTPTEVGIWVERDGGPWQVSISGKGSLDGTYCFTYVTLDEDAGEDDLYTMQDLMNHLEKNNKRIHRKSLLVTTCDDGDLDPEDEDDPRNGENQVKSFKFEDGEDNVKAAKVILVC